MELPRLGAVSHDSMNKIPLLRLIGCLLVANQSAAATLTPFAGNGTAGSGGDGGTALAATLNNPFGLVRGPDRALWFADYEAHVIRRIAPDGTIRTVVGTGSPGYGGDGRTGPEAQLHNPHELRFDPSGNLFIADTSNNAIRRYDLKSGKVSTYAGTGDQGYSGDGGPATKARFNGPISIQFNPDGDLFIADIGNHLVRRVDSKTGILTTFAGTGKPGTTPNGAPISGTPLSGPRSIDFDIEGNLLLVTREGNQLFRLERVSQIIHLLAGNGRRGMAGGTATEAQMNGPKGLTVARDGTVYIADTENHAIRRYRPSTATLDTVIGNGAAGSGFPSDPTQACLKRPHGVFLEADGTLLVGDSENHRILALPRMNRP
jgi:streptogramin lyase